MASQGGKESIAKPATLAWTSGAKAPGIKPAMHRSTSIIVSEFMIQLSLQQSLARQTRIARRHLWDKILLNHDEILEFDPKTGGLKRWAW
jgi:hypothetical protein